MTGWRGGARRINIEQQRPDEEKRENRREQTSLSQLCHATEEGGVLFQCRRAFQASSTAVQRDDLLHHIRLRSSCCPEKVRELCRLRTRCLH